MDGNVSIERTFMAAEKFCRTNPAWMQIKDISQDDYKNRVMVGWGDLPKKERNRWVNLYGENAEDAWIELETHPRYKVDHGFVGADGCFYVNCLEMPLVMNAVMVFRLGEHGGGDEGRNSDWEVD